MTSENRFQQAPEIRWKVLSEEDIRTMEGSWVREQLSKFYSPTIEVLRELGDITDRLLLIVSQ